ncbi:hypothetical protein SEVIR_1G214451v4 [Setaria viridis]|uniref:Uncharacterized protein n=1 Tax=Setaria viridis TaxID=4556 RepID=A0A4U6WDX3_SETVI|nr:hypothetical protein SEVIR_1G214451v2 [Setaria viridis]
MSARASVAGKISLSSEHIFPFLQKYSLSDRSSGKSIVDSFVPNALLASLSSGTEASIFPTFFLRSASVFGVSHWPWADDKPAERLLEESRRWWAAGIIERRKANMSQCKSFIRPFISFPWAARRWRQGISEAHPRGAARQQH